MSTIPPISLPLIQAAQAVIDRWDSHSWRGLPSTAEYINALRSAIADHLLGVTKMVSSEIRLLTPEGIEAELSKNSRYLNEPLTGNERKLLRDTLTLLRPYLRTTEPVSLKDIEAIFVRKYLEVFEGVSSPEKADFLALKAVLDVIGVKYDN